MNETNMNEFWELLAESVAGLAAHCADADPDATDNAARREAEQESDGALPER